MKIGLALGGGGAKGLAHIPMLEVLDELKIVPHKVTGTSIGAIMGALYCSGLTGKEMFEIAKEWAPIRKKKNNEYKNIKDILDKNTLKKIRTQTKDSLKWLNFFDFDLKGKGILKGDNFIDFIQKQIGGISTFEELKIPLSTVATDFWTGEQVVFNSGGLLNAVKASMGLPGVFSPVTIDNKVLIDGGGVNPVPHDLLTDCDFVIAIDVMGNSEYDPENKIPNLVNSVLGMFHIMQMSIIKEKLKLSPPDIYIRPNIKNVDILDFNKIEYVYKEALPDAEILKKELQKIIEKI